MLALKDHTTTCQNPETPSSPSTSSHFHLILNNPDYVQHCHYPRSALFLSVPKDVPHCTICWSYLTQHPLANTTRFNLIISTGYTE